MQKMTNPELCFDNLYNLDKATRNCVFCACKTYTGIKITIILLNNTLLLRAGTGTHRIRDSINDK